MIYRLKRGICIRPVGKLNQLEKTVSLNLYNTLCFEKKKCGLSPLFKTQMPKVVKFSIPIAIIFVWTAFFLFPMIHDLVHELGHAAVQLVDGCSYVKISLGEYAYCQGDSNSRLSFCVFPGWFYRSLYRNSQSAAECTWPAGMSRLVTVMGGIFGLGFSWILITAVVTLIWRFFVQANPRKAFLVGFTFAFIPLKWLKELRIRPLWLHMLFGLGAIVIQFDLVNELFYTFFPSRLIIWTFMEWGDGSNLWRESGFSEETILNVSYAVFAMLLLTYILILTLFIRYCRFLHKRRRASAEVRPFLEKVDRL